ncbi:hypothetical protein BT67DRAFT_485581 [Trichocladium antarcticum]|uniref:Checkpoint protein RAD24-like helical bundle domain-containing protein n=1 Tax=Trichocladium antarcticum TaxID=1450529 RepID=A0AAN6UFJ1_9PEZI|nr:hypothetical protein BT67DRAFT_485581 [Trichocladium antarcticum]
MAPAAKRRKRAIVDDDSDDNDQAHQKNTLKRFLFSPDKPKQATTTTAAPTIDEPPNSPLPRKRTTRAAAAAAAATAAASPNPPQPPLPRPKTKPTAGATHSPSTSPLKSRTRAGQQQRKRKAAGGGSSDSRAQPNGTGSADLPTLFSRQSQRRRPLSGSPAELLGRGAGNGYTKGGIGGGGKVDDIVSDPISVSEREDEDDDVPLILASSAAAAASLVGRAKAAHQRFEGAGNGGGNGGGNGNGNGNGGGVRSSQGAGGGQRFLRPPPPPRSGGGGMKSGSAGADEGPGADARPWSERFGPVGLDELAVHKRKVLDVRRWLDEVFSGRLGQRLLVLKGPAGSGKTTTLRLLARDMRCEVLEWKNPASSFGITGYGYQSAAVQFEEFLGRGGKFGQLDVESEEEGTPPPPAPLSSAPLGNGTDKGSDRRLILVEEFPNTFMRSSAGLVAFRNAIEQFLAANTPAPGGSGYSHHAEPITPIVMVISETLLTTTSASADSFTAHRLLGPEILRHPGTGMIEFNPIAPTFLSKALELVVQKEARKSGRRRTPGPIVLQRLGEIGDIRNAISSLEFLCVKGDDDTEWGSKVAFTKPKRGSRDVPVLTKGEQESLELISQREATLGIFHAVGKVVYNKRGDFPAASAEAAAEMLPDYMAHLSKPKRSDVSADTLMDEIGTDTHTFISALHENYALSCEQTGPLDENSSLDYINGCLDYLSESDLLSPSADIFFGGKGSGGGYWGQDSGSHVLRQDEMAFQVAVRGLLFSLPSPVRRQTHPTGRGSDAYKMFYPTYLKLWRTKEELEGLVDMWATKMLKGEDGGPGPPQTQPQLTHSGSSVFRKTAGLSNGFPSSPTPSSSAARHAAKSGADHAHASSPSPSPLLSLGSAARSELLLERLPYMAHIARRRRTSFGTMRAKDFDRIVSFHGIGTLGAGEDEGAYGADGADEEGSSGGGAATWATDRPTEEASPRKRRGLGAILSSSAGRGKGDAEGLPGLPMASLVISDDDIEDD